MFDSVEKNATWLLDRCACVDATTSITDGDRNDLHFLNLESPNRFLESKDDAPVWETVVVSVTLFVMFVFMLTDRIGPDWVFVAGLTLFMACEIVTIKEGLVGFSNEGILTVMALFVVAEGVSRTGALDYYMGLAIGKPKTVAGAQVRLMVPIAIISAFLNNTPIVAVMIPLTLRWAKNIGVPRQQLLIPLSYATILGGTCTLVGTSTNLVVSGLYEKQFPNENIGLFDIAVYGVPNCLIGLAYMLIFAPFLLPLGGNASTGMEVDELLLGARVTPWSPAANRTVMRSGLGNSGGVYLVNVRRAATGNIHRAVSKDFVISVGDELFFTANLDEFADFCEKKGLEIITTENIASSNAAGDDDATTESYTLAAPTEAAERRRRVCLLSDQIEGRETVEPGPRPTSVIVTTDGTDKAILVGVDCRDRSGLLMDISAALFEHGLKLRHSEAKVVGDRSLSVWRCQTSADRSADLEEIWSALDVLLGSSSSASDRALTGTTKSGTRIIRAHVAKSSSLIGKKPQDVNFRRSYKAAIVAYQKKGKNATMDAELAAGDLLVLETIEGTTLLTKPPKGFYDKDSAKASRRSITIPERPAVEEGVDTEDTEINVGKSHEVWRDLTVVFDEDADDNPSQLDVPKGEFLTAFCVPPDSFLQNKSLNELGFSRLPGVVLVSIERPKVTEKDTKLNGNEPASDGVKESRFTALSPDDPLRVGDVFWFSGSAEAIGDLRKVHGLVFYQQEEMKKAVSILQDRRLVQAVVARGSPLVGQTVKDVHFRSQYGGAVIAIQRGSERVHEHPASVPLQTGDVLLVEAGPSFVERHDNNYRTFALVSEVEGSSPPRPRLFLLCVLLIAGSLTVAALDIRSLLITASIVGIVMVSLGIVTQQEARDALQWDLFVVVASAFGVGNAMVNSGVAEGLATFFVNVGQWFGIGDAGIYGSIYLAGNLLSAVLTNNAAAALMYPIAMDAVKQTNTDSLKMTFILMLSASDYITSFGYQTNLMVYGPGGYKNVDFMKFGAPMQILLWLSSTAMVSSSGDNWYISWFICAIGFVVIAAVRLTNGTVLQTIKNWQGDKNKPVESSKGGTTSSWHFSISQKKAIVTELYA